MPLPAHFHEPNSLQAGPTVETKRLSRRMYVYWAFALTFLATVGLFCWLVMVPVLEVRRFVSWRLRILDYSSYVEEGRALGTPTEVLKKIRLYMKMPDFLAPGKEHAAILCLISPDEGIRELGHLLDHRSRRVRDQVLEMLAVLHVEGHEEAGSILKAISVSDPDPRARKLASMYLGDPSIGDCNVLGLPEHFGEDSPARTRTRDRLKEMLVELQER